MKSNIFDELMARGLIKQTVYEEELKEMLTNEKIKFYVGFDPTADSLTVGHLLVVTLAKRFQLYGHKPYLLMGGGTGMVGDPSGRTDMRKMLTLDEIDHNISRFEDQIKKIVDLDGEAGAVIVNNGDWLKALNYIEFIREIGSLMSVNKMLSFDCFKNRLEKGLSFLELNYMPMQAYDFLHLYKTEGVCLQVGGDDQWANMLAGADIIRRKLRKPAFALTAPLITKTDGTKMGKTAGGALWLDPEKTSPYDLFQYFRNTPDEKVREYFLMLTFVDVEEIEKLTAHQDERMNIAKERFAYEMVKLIHGEGVADKTLIDVKATFSGKNEDMPTLEIDGDDILSALMKANFVKTTSEGRRMIAQNAVKINDQIVTDINITLPDEFILSKGKKNIIKIKRVK